MRDIGVLSSLWPSLTLSNKYTIPGNHLIEPALLVVLTYSASSGPFDSDISIRYCLYSTFVIHHEYTPYHNLKSSASQCLHPSEACIHCHPKECRSHVIELGSSTRKRELHRIEHCQLNRSTKSRFFKFYLRVYKRCILNNTRETRPIDIK